MIQTHNQKLKTGLRRHGSNTSNHDFRSFIILGAVVITNAFIIIINDNHSNLNKPLFTISPDEMVIREKAAGLITAHLGEKRLVIVNLDQRLSKDDYLVIWAKVGDWVSEIKDDRSSDRMGTVLMGLA